MLDTRRVIDSQSVKTVADSEGRGMDGGENKRQKTAYRSGYHGESAASVVWAGQRAVLHVCAGCAELFDMRGGDSPYVPDDREGRPMTLSHEQALCLLS